MPPFTVQYYCPRQGNFWQGNRVVIDFNSACGWAAVMKPARGNARVVDATGQVVYQI